MRSQNLVLACALVVTLPLVVAAQPPAPAAASLIQIAVTCAPPPMTTLADASMLHVIGSQDTVPRTLFDQRDLLLIDGGTAKGVQLGQEYFVRRAAATGVYGGGLIRRTVHTAGWIKVVAVNQTTAIATVERACDYLRAGDYLEPFEVPPVPAEASHVDRSGEPDFASLGRVLVGQDEHLTAGVGDFVMIDRGADQSLAPGARLAIYRDVQMIKGAGPAPAQLPLTAIGEGVVISMSPTMSVVRIVSARDAVRTGDFVAPRKK